MAVADSMESLIWEAIRQATPGKLARILNYARTLSSDSMTDPEIYAGVTPGGMSFEIPSDQIKPFLCLLVETLGAEQVLVSYRENGHFVERVYRLETLETELDDIQAHLADPSFLMEFEGGALYTGGDGCFSLRASLTPGQVQQLTSGVLSLAGFNLYEHKKVTGVAVFDSKVVTYG